ncbi:Fanconi anemia-associated protein of 100 kDa [Stylophora pistillata]|uniref:Fanconi anemia-associated protein of 100 kDa n=1 Tax=Stylophora pistillata TaxID=50429 RepID=A0A2B4SVH9_STYPI|nr:Fanconi anemia-associated protein of 100 kDa [Stylophora pistillata]
MLKMADHQVKTIQRFSPLKPIAAPEIVIHTVSKRKSIVLLSNGSQFLYILVDDSVEHTFRFPNSVTTVRVQEHNAAGKRQVLVGTVDGHIFAVSLPENLTKSSRLITFTDPKPDITAETAKQKKCVEHDIFGELLAGGNNDVTETVNKQSLTANKFMTVVDMESAVLYEPNLRTFMTIKENVVCCRALKQGYLFSVFCPISQQNDLGMMTYAPLPVFKGMITAESELEKGSLWNNVPQLCCVQARGNVSCLSSCLTIEQSLFSKLFHCDASLLDTPVIIFACEDGQVLFWPVSSFALTNANIETRVSECQFSPQLMYHLEQRLVATYAARLYYSEDLSICPSTASETEVRNCKHKQESDGCCNALVFVGGCDKIIIVSEGKHLSDKSEEGNTINFTRHTIIGPVLCSCMSSSHDTLIHSTGKEIFITKLSLNCEMNAAKSGATFLSSSKLASLNMLTVQVPNVSVLCCVNKKRKGNGTKTQVYALTVSGKLVLFSLPELQDGEQPIASNVSSQMVGEKVKSYLQEIETQTAELVRINESIEKANKTLKELNEIIHIASRVTEKVGDTTLPLSCSFTPTVVCHSSSGHNSLSLLCKVINQGNLMLPPSWSLMVHIQGKEPWQSCTPVAACSMGRSIPLRTTHSGEVTKITIAVDKSFSSSFHFIVEGYLYCDLNSLLADLRNGTNQIHFFKMPVENIVIPVRQKVFDTLHWVQPTQLGPQVQTDCTIPNSKEEILQTVDRLNSTINNVPVITCGTSRNQMRAYDVQKQLEKLQDLHKCVILLEDEMSMGTDKRESIAVKRTLWALYEKVRGVILMI